VGSQIGVSRVRHHGSVEVAESSRKPRAENNPLSGRSHRGRASLDRNGLIR
jgi:hypothetical protein